MGRGDEVALGVLAVEVEEIAGEVEVMVAIGEEMMVGTVGETGVTDMQMEDWEKCKHCGMFCCFLGHSGTKWSLSKLDQVHLACRTQ